MENICRFMLNAAIMPLCSCKINHTFDLHHAAAGMCGVGGDDSWGAPVLAEYVQKNETRHLAFTLKGL